MCLAMFPILLLISRWVSNRLAGLTREQMDGNADMGNAMTERFNVGGAMLLKLFGRRDEEDAVFATKAARVRDLGIQISLLTRIFAAAMMTVPALATAVVYGVGGWLVIDGHLTLGTLLALGTLLLRLLGPLQGLSNVRIDVMTALVSFERVFEVLDLPSMIQEKPDAVALPPGSGQRRVRPRRVRLPAGRGHLAGLARGGGPQGVPRLGSGAQRHLLHRDAGPDGRPGRPVRGRQDHDDPPGRPALRRRLRSRPRRWPRRPRRHAAVAGGRGRLRHPGRAHVPRDHPVQPSLRAPRGQRRGHLERHSRPPRSRC